MKTPPHFRCNPSKSVKRISLFSWKTVPSAIDGNINSDISYRILAYFSLGISDVNFLLLTLRVDLRLTFKTHRSDW